MQSAYQAHRSSRHVIAALLLLKLPELTRATFQLPMPAECLYEQRDSETQTIFDQYAGSMYSE